MTNLKTHAAVQRILFAEALDEVGTYRRDLTKWSTSQAAVKGLAAMETLLTGARKYMTTKNGRFYKKNG